jgi:hypothetical protein
MDTAKPWYLSKSVLASLAAILMLIGGKFGLLPADMTSDKMIGFLVLIIPMIVSLIGRVTASHKITATKGGADLLNGG